MTGTLSLRLLGPPEIWVRGDDVSHTLDRKTRAILAYLAITDRGHSRRSLYDLFCQRARDPGATLRWHLSRIRRQLGTEALVLAGSTVAITREGVWVDCLAFQDVLQRELGGIELETLTAAVGLYRGRFLKGMTLRDSAEFELWLLGERTRFRILYQRGLTAIVDRLVASQQFEQAIGWAQRLVESNHFLEEGHARLIWLYARIGQRDAALEQFDLYARWLRQELGLEPPAGLVRLREQILGGGLEPAPAWVRTPGGPL